LLPIPAIKVTSQNEKSHRKRWLIFVSEVATRQSRGSLNLASSRQSCDWGGAVLRPNEIAPPAEDYFLPLLVAGLAEAVLVGLAAVLVVFLLVAMESNS
jgi:hypothetical protein